MSLQTIVICFSESWFSVDDDATVFGAKHNKTTFVFNNVLFIGVHGYAL